MCQICKYGHGRKTFLSHIETQKMSSSSSNNLADSKDNKGRGKSNKQRKYAEHNQKTLLPKAPRVLFSDISLCSSNCSNANYATTKHQQKRARNSLFHKEVSTTDTSEEKNIRVINYLRYLNHSNSNTNIPCTQEKTMSVSTDQSKKKRGFLGKYLKFLPGRKKFYKKIRGKNVPQLSAIRKSQSTNRALGGEHSEIIQKMAEKKDSMKYDRNYGTIKNDAYKKRFNQRQKHKIDIQSNYKQKITAKQNDNRSKSQQTFNSGIEYNVNGRQTMVKDENKTMVTAEALNPMKRDLKNGNLKDNEIDGVKIPSMNANIAEIKVAEDINEYQVEKKVKAKLKQPIPEKNNRNYATVTLKHDELSPTVLSKCTENLIAVNLKPEGDVRKSLRDTEVQTDIEKPENVNDPNIIGTSKDKKCQSYRNPCKDNQFNFPRTSRDSQSQTDPLLLETNLTKKQDNASSKKSEEIRLKVSTNPPYIDCNQKRHKHISGCQQRNKMQNRSRNWNRPNSPGLMASASCLIERDTYIQNKKASSKKKTKYLTSKSSAEDLKEKHHNKITPSIKLVGSNISDNTLVNHVPVHDDFIPTKRTPKESQWRCKNDYEQQSSPVTFHLNRLNKESTQMSIGSFTSQSINSNTTEQLMGSFVSNCLRRHSQGVRIESAKLTVAGEACSYTPRRSEKTNSVNYRRYGGYSPHTVRPKIIQKKHAHFRPQRNLQTRNSYRSYKYNNGQGFRIESAKLSAETPICSTRHSAAACNRLVQRSNIVPILLMPQTEFIYYVDSTDNLAHPQYMPFDSKGSIDQGIVYDDTTKSDPVILCNCATCNVQHKGKRNLRTFEELLRENIRRYNKHVEKTFGSAQSRHP